MSGFIDPEVEELLGGFPPSSNLPVPVGLRVQTGTGTELAIAGDAFEGASAISREMATYAPALRSADQDMLPAKRMSDARTRDMMRNDAYIQNAATLRKDNIVGSYYMLNSKPVTSVLFPGKTDSFKEGFEEAFQEEVEEKFGLWAESPDNLCDASRHNGLTGMTRMAVDMHTVSGEVLASAEWMRDSSRSFQTAMQMIDVDRLSDPQDITVDRKFVKGGVRKDKYGAAIGYYIRMAHPSDWTTPDAYKWKYVPARKPWGRLQMLHIFEQLRPDQTRGMSLMVAALSEMKMTKNFRKMVLQNAVLNATYAATIESELPTEAIFAQLGGGEMTADSIQAALTGYIGGHFETIGQFVGGSKNLHIDGVKIPHLPPGSKLNLRGAGQGGPLGTDFETSLLRHIAAALGVSYEQLSKDYTQTNYSSARAAMNDTHKAMLSIKKAVADRFAGTMFRLWLEEALNKGEITTIGTAAPSWYEGMNFDAYSACDWVGASRGQVDELKETQAAVMRINNGLSDLETENARLGADWRRRMRQMKREQTWKDKYGVLQDVEDTTSQQMNAASGSKNEKEDA